MKSVHFKIIYFDIQPDFWLVKNNYQHLSKLYNLAIYVATPTFAGTTFSYMCCVLLLVYFVYYNNDALVFFVNKFNQNNIFVCFLINPSKISIPLFSTYHINWNKPRSGFEPKSLMQTRVLSIKLSQSLNTDRLTKSKTLNYFPTYISLKILRFNL